MALTMHNRPMRASLDENTAYICYKNYRNWDGKTDRRQAEKLILQPIYLGKKKKEIR